MIGRRRTLAVVGRGLPAALAALASARQGIRTLWFERPETRQRSAAPLLSLSSRGSALLRTLLPTSTLERLSEGHFHDVLGGAPEQPSAASRGYHVVSTRLYQAVRDAARDHGAECIPEAVVGLDTKERSVALHVGSGRCRRVGAVLLSEAPPAAPIRRVVQTAAAAAPNLANTARFHVGPGWWSFRAYDRRGDCTLTGWSQQPGAWSEDASALHAVRIYRRRSCPAPRVFAIGRRAFGIDPVTGYGLTIDLEDICMLLGRLTTVDPRGWGDAVVWQPRHVHLSRLLDAADAVTERVYAEAVGSSG